MARKKGQETCKHPMIAYKYGLLDPSPDTFGIVKDQLQKARKYQNQLVEIENKRRQEYRLLTSNSVTEALDAKIEKIREELNDLHTKAKAASQRARAKVPMLEVDKARVKLLKSENSSLYEELKAVRKLIKTPEVIEQIQKSKDKADQAVRDFRTNKDAQEPHGTFWGSYLLREASVEQSKKLVPVSEDLRFLRFDRGQEGCLGIQIQGGMPVAEAYAAQDRRLRILVPDTAPAPRGPDGQPSKRSERRKRVVLQVRLQSTDKKQPVWAYFPMVLHRPLPEHARIKEVKVQLTMIGNRRRWEAIFILQSEGFEVAPVLSGSTVGVNVGWRVFKGEGVRAGYAVYSDGRERDMRVPQVIRDILDHADGLRSLQDQQFNTMQTELLTWIREKSPRLPEPLYDIAKHLHLFKSCRSLERLYYTWKENRFEGDQSIFEILFAWRKRYRHLYAWETSERTTAILRRKEWARLEAIQMLKGCRKLVCEDIAIKELAKRLPPEEDKVVIPESRHKRQQTAPGEFRAILKAAAKKRGIEVVVVKSQYITKSCHVCGVINLWDQARELMHVCDGCGAKWDQDKNAARNVLTLSNNPETKDDSLILAAE